MIRRLILILLLISYYSGRSQGNVSVGFAGEYSENFNFRNYSGGLQVEVPVGDNFTLNYKAILGASSDRAFYLHAPLGAATGVVILHYLGSSNSSAINTFGALLIAIPEGVTFYPNPDADIRVGILVNPLGCDYWRKKHAYEYFKLSGELGAKIKFPIAGGDGDIFLQSGVRYIYNKKHVDPFFLYAGAGVAFNFNR